MDAAGTFWITVLVGSPLGLWVQYLIIKYAVRNGIVAAQDHLDRLWGATHQPAPASPPQIHAEPESTIKSCKSQVPHAAHKYASRDGGRMCPGYPGQNAETNIRT
jgi:hypothetical protein